MEDIRKLNPGIELTKGLICKIVVTEDNSDKLVVTAKITKIFSGDASNKELCLLKATVGSRRYASFRNEIKSIQFG